MSVAFSTLIQETEQALSQVDGTSVQIYAEDRIALYLQETFDMVWDELWWPNYMQWLERTLDGTQGVVTENLDVIDDFNDIRYVFRDGYHTPLKILPGQINPFEINGGTGPKYISRHEDDDRLIQFWPKTATGKVYIHAKIKPDDFTTNDTNIKMDKWLLINGAAYKYAEDDGTNIGAIQKFQNAFESRLNQLKSDYNNQPIDLDPFSGQIPTTWQEGRFV